jgi:hypothetical protein
MSGWLTGGEVSVGWLAASAHLLGHLWGGLRTDYCSPCGKHYRRLGRYPQIMYVSVNLLACTEQRPQLVTKRPWQRKLRGKRESTVHCRGTGEKWKDIRT